MSREISIRIYTADKQNYSTANDLAVDTLLIGDILNQLGVTEQAHKMFIETEEIMEPIHRAEANNKYYAHTLLVTKLHLNKFEEAKKLYVLTHQNDMVDGVVKDLLVKKQFTELAKRLAQLKQVALKNHSILAMAIML